MSDILSIIVSCYGLIAFVIWVWLFVDDLLWSGPGRNIWESVATALLWPVIGAVKLAKAIYLVLWETFK